MNCLEIECPFCGVLKKISLKAKPHHLIIPCDRCHNIMLFYRDKVYRVDKVMLSTFLQTENSGKILEMMETFHKKGGRRRRAGPFRPLSAPLPHAKRRALALVKKASRREPISRQDVIDLVIDLHTSKSVADFLTKLE